jgi:hypothetical protein
MSKENETMRRIALLALLLTSAWVTAEPNSSVKTSLYVRFPKPIPLGEGKFQPGIYHLGTGTIVKVEPGRFWVLTCAHTVVAKEEGETSFSVTLHNGKVYPANVALYDVKTDLGLVYIDAKTEVTPAVLAEEDVVPLGTKTYRYGWATGSRKTQEASKSANTRFTGAKDVLLHELDNGSDHGDSGSGLFRVSDGKLVGVVWGGRTNAQAVTTVDVRKFLVKAEQVFQKQPAPPPAKGGPRPKSERVPAKVLDGSAVDTARPLPLETRAVLVDLGNLKVRFVRVGNKVYEVSVKDVTPVTKPEPINKAPTPEKTPDKVPEKGSAPPKE